MVDLALWRPSARAETAGRSGASWNDQTNRAIQATKTDAFQASRALALESIAVLDTIRSLGGVPGLMVRLPAPKDAKPEIAVAAAAHTMLGTVSVAPGHVGRRVRGALTTEPDNPSRAASGGVRQAVADAVFAVRDRDGWNVAKNAPR